MTILFSNRWAGCCSEGLLVKIILVSNVFLALTVEISLIIVFERTFFVTPPTRARIDLIGLRGDSNCIDEFQKTCNIISTIKYRILFLCKCILNNDFDWWI